LKCIGASKTTESFGSGLDRRLSADDLDRLDQLPAHVAELVRAAWELGGRPELERLSRDPPCPFLPSGFQRV
jgi:hypothetical protein